MKKLEEGDLPLETSLQLYERGVQLSRFCHAQLEQAEKRIEILNERGGLKSGAGESRRGRSFDTAIPSAAEGGRERRSCAAMTPRLIFRYSPPGARDRRGSSGGCCRRRRSVRRPSHEAMHYSVTAGGKRLRPILCLAGAEAVGRRLAQTRCPPPVPSSSFTRTR